jgi:hypothetical protein
MNTYAARKGFVVLAVGFLSSTVWAAGPSLNIGKISGQPGNTIDLPVKFDPGSTSISGMQFNLTMPASTSIDTVLVGDDLKAAGKSVNSNHKGQVWTFIIFGLNQNTNLKGTLFTAKVKIDAMAAKGTFKIPAGGVVYTDPNGKMIPAGSRRDGTLTVK